MQLFDWLFFFTLCGIGTISSTGAELVKMPAKRVLALALPIDYTRG